MGPQTWFGFGPKVGLSGEGRSIRDLLVYDNVYGGSANANDLTANLHRTSGDVAPSDRRLDQPQKARLFIHPQGHPDLLANRGVTQSTRADLTGDHLT